MPPRNPGEQSQTRVPAGVNDVALVPEFVDTDEALVQSWFEGYDDQGTNSVSAGDGDQAAANWLSSVLVRAPRPGRLGVGAEPPKKELSEEVVALSKVTKRVLGRKRRREAEEEEQARASTSSKVARGRPSAVRAERKAARGKGDAVANADDAESDASSSADEVGFRGSTTVARAAGNSVLDKALAEAAAAEAEEAEAKAKRAEAQRRKRKRKQEKKRLGAAA